MREGTKRSASLEPSVVEEHRRRRDRDGDEPSPDPPRVRGEAQSDGDDLRQRIRLHAYTLVLECVARLRCSSWSRRLQIILMSSKAGLVSETRPTPGIRPEFSDQTDRDGDRREASEVALPEHPSSSGMLVSGSGAPSPFPATSLLGRSS